jgi:hypothetical protein
MKLTRIYTSARSKKKNAASNSHRKSTQKFESSSYIALHKISDSCYTCPHCILVSNCYPWVASQKEAFGASPFHSLEGEAHSFLQNLVLPFQALVVQAKQEVTIEHTCSATENTFISVLL